MVDILEQADAYGMWPEYSHTPSTALLNILNHFWKIPTTPPRLSRLRRDNGAMVTGLATHFISESSCIVSTMIFSYSSYAHDVLDEDGGLVVKNRLHMGWIVVFLRRSSAAKQLALTDK